LSEVGGLSELATPWYSDQILPFDITLAGSNEYGAQAASKIFGVEILNEGSGISIDDAVSEMQATFTFRRRSWNTPWSPPPPAASPPLQRAGKSAALFWHAINYKKKSAMLRLVEHRALLLTRSPGLKSGSHILVAQS